MTSKEQTTYFLGENVFLSIQDNIAQILDFDRGEFYGLDPIATVMVSLVLEKGIEETITGITQTYEVNEDCARADLTELLQNLEQKKLIIAQGKKSNPFLQWFHDQKKKTAKLLDAILLWFLKRVSSIIHRLIDNEQTPSRRTVELLLTLSWISFRLLGWSRTISLWQHWHYQLEESDISDSGLTQLNKSRLPSSPNLGGESAQKSPRIDACACACEALPEGSALPEGAALPEGSRVSRPSGQTPRRRQAFIPHSLGFISHSWRQGNADQERERAS